MYSQFDIADGKPRVVMFCHDQHLDRRVIAQAQSLIARGCKVTLFALSYTTEDEAQVTPEGIRLIRIGLKKIVPANALHKGYVKRRNFLNFIGNKYDSRIRWASFLWWLMIRIARGVNRWSHKALLLLHYRNRNITDPLPFTSAFLDAGRSVSADLIQVHDLPALEAGVQLAEDKSVPLVYDAHELYPEQHSFSAIQTRICAQTEARLITHADLVFAVNESIGTEMSKRYGIPQPITVLNAVDPVPEFDITIKYDLLRKKIGLGFDRKILLFQGGFSPNRNLTELVVAMSLVKNPVVDLVLLGFGGFGAVLKKKAANLGLLDKRVFFLEAVPSAELIQHSASADMGIIPYPHSDLNSYYCTPNKLFEFIQAGLPILANDSPELRRFVADTGFGLVMPANTPKEIALAIDQAFESEKYEMWRESLVQKRYEYSWEVQSAAYVDAMMPFLVDRGVKKSGYGPGG